MALISAGPTRNGADAVKTVITNGPDDFCMSTLPLSASVVEDCIISATTPNLRRIRTGVLQLMPIHSMHHQSSHLHRLMNNPNSSEIEPNCQSRPGHKQSESPYPTRRMALSNSPTRVECQQKA